MIVSRAARRGYAISTTTQSKHLKKKNGADDELTTPWVDQLSCKLIAGNFRRITGAKESTRYSECTVLRRRDGYSHCEEMTCRTVEKKRAARRKYLSFASWRDDKHSTWNFMSLKRWFVEWRQKETNGNGAPTKKDHATGTTNDR